MSAMDKSLDDIIATRPKGIRRTSRRGGGGKAQVLGKNTGATPSAKAKVAAAQSNSGQAPSQSATKIIVSNLPQDVTEPQIKELFSQTVGPLRHVTLNYDAKGNSKGVATIDFARQGDANKAFSQYNNRLIDGKRAMKIEIVVDLSRPLSLASRVAPAPQAAATTPARGGGRGRRGRRGGGRGGRSERAPKTAADLDAEMEDYTSSNAPAAAATST